MPATKEKASKLKLAESGKGGFINALKQAFPFFNEQDNDQSNVSFEVGAGYTGSAFTEKGTDLVDGNSALVGNGRKNSDRLHIQELPKDRFLRYNIFHEMADDSTISAAIEYHLANALSVPTTGGLSVYLHPKSEKDTEIVKQLNDELMGQINQHLMSWCYTMCIYGVNYVRPYAIAGKGITHFEANYYTLPNQVREYERSGALAGFTSEYLTEKSTGERVNLASPWSLIPLKLPVWKPDMEIMPTNYSGKRYSLYSDAYSREVVETQNYGGSMLATSYEVWSLLRQNIASLGASRVNASLIDRLITTNTEGLDPVRAAEYINLVANQLKQDRQEVITKSQKTGILPTVMNTLIPVMNGKGSLQIDTFTTDPNISHIEDIMFNIKRLGGSLGVDISMIGFSDVLSGGLGDGGFTRTSIQSALRSNQIRSAVNLFVQRAIDIHTAYKDNKVWSPTDRPYEIKFNSLNTAIQQEESANKESAVNYATMLSTVLDMIEQSPISKSSDLKSYLYTSILSIDPEKAKVFISQLAAKAETDEGMMEAIGMRKGADSEQYIRDVILDMMNDLD